MKLFAPSIVRLCAGAALLALASAQALAQAYPSRPITFFLPVPPGGALDIFARALNQGFTARSGQPLLIENRPGADFVIAAEACARAKPDGYTLCMLLRDNTSILPLIRKLPYDPDRDLTPVTNMVNIQNVLVAHASVPVKNFKELVAFSQKNPEFLNWSAFGSSQLLIEWVVQQSGLKMTFVRYKGQQDANKDFLGGRLHVYYPAVGNANLPQDVNSGKVTGLIVAGNKRIAQIPNVPTFTEMGLPDFDVRSWLGAFMPAGVPRETAARIAGDFTAVIRSPEFIQKYLTPGGFEPLGGTPDEFAAFLKEDKKVGAIMAKLAPRPE
jgi:tripartite-type tricarboxylate transporter receptor subunit TctC